VVVDNGAGGGSGVVPYLPLPELERRARDRAVPGAESNGDSQ
jgi:hypothetical protein